MSTRLVSPLTLESFVGASKSQEMALLYFNVYRLLLKSRKVFVMFRFDLLINKLIAILLIAIGVVPVLLDKDATFLVFALILAVPMFFSKRSWVEL